MVWHVDAYVRKLAICRYPVTRQVGRVLRLAHNLRTRIRLYLAARRWAGLRGRPTAIIG